MRPSTPRRSASLLRPAVDRSFNQVSVDGDTSTNDAVFVLANGAAGGPSIAAEDVGAFADALEAVCRSLAIAIAADGEGAEHLIEVTVNGAADDADARAVARTVAASSLVKTAVHGADPNWGRIAAAAGRSGVRFDPDRMRICIGDVAVYDGSPLAFDERRARRILGGARVPLVLDLLDGPGSGTAWGCDLSAAVRRHQQRVHDMNGSALTIKLGGTAGAHAASLAVLVERAEPGWVIVHGGGAEVGDWSRRLGVEPTTVDGLRVTDPTTLEIAVAVLRGVVNARLVATFGAAGVAAVGLCGVDGDLLNAERFDRAAR